MKGQTDCVSDKVYFFHRENIVSIENNPPEKRYRATATWENPVTQVQVNTVGHGKNPEDALETAMMGGDF